MSTARIKKGFLRVAVSTVGGAVVSAAVGAGSSALGAVIRRAGHAALIETVMMNAAGSAVTGAAGGLLMGSLTQGCYGADRRVESTIIDLQAYLARENNNDDCRKSVIIFLVPAIILHFLGAPLGYAMLESSSNISPREFSDNTFLGDVLVFVPAILIAIGLYCVLGDAVEKWLDVCITKQEDTESEKKMPSV